MNALVKTTEFQPHPAANLFPLMNGAEFEAFKADIAANGLLEAIWLFEHQILDGRNRYKACKELGIEPMFRAYEGPSPVAFAWSVNGARRHLGKSQLAAIAVSFLPELKEEAKKRQIRKPENSVPTLVREQNDPHKSEAVAQAAAIVGVSPSLVQQAQSVSKASPELFAEVADGSLSLHAARDVLKGRPRPQSAANKNPQPKEKRVTDIKRLAAEGNTAEQIAHQIDTSAANVKQLAHEAGVKLPGAKHHRVTTERIVMETVVGIENYVKGLSLLPSTFEFDHTRAVECDFSLAQSSKAIAKLRKQLQVFFT